LVVVVVKRKFSCFAACVSVLFCVYPLLNKGGGGGVVLCVVIHVCVVIIFSIVYTVRQ